MQVDVRLDIATFALCLAARLNCYQGNIEEEEGTWIAYAS
jgi:hypothetical protein